jgi:hypothetical protein
MIMNGNPETPGQSQKIGRTAGVTAPTGPVRSLFRPRPWAGPCPSVDSTAPETRRPRTHSGRQRPGNAPRAAYALVSGLALGEEGRAVKPSAQPTLVRTQHLPHQRKDSLTSSYMVKGSLLLVGLYAAGGGHVQVAVANTCASPGSLTAPARPGHPATRRNFLPVRISRRPGGSGCPASPGLR